MTRTSLMINREIANALADDAQKQGKPLFYLANDLIKVYLRAREKGYDLEKVVDAYEALMFARRMGHILISDDMFDVLVGRSVAGKAERFIPASKESGKKMGRYIESMYPNPIDGLRHLLPNMFWDISFDLRIDGNTGTLCVTCPHQSHSRALLVGGFIEGFLEACNYSLQRREIMQGLIKIEFSKNIL